MPIAVTSKRNSLFAETARLVSDDSPGFLHGGRTIAVYMAQRFYLYWLRENGCDVGTPLRADELDPAIQAKVMELAGDCEDVSVRLPYLEKKEWRKREKALGALELLRQGDLIFPALSPAMELRNAAAYLALADPVWMNSPTITGENYFPVWQNVSMTLQALLREWIPAEYFRDSARYQDRSMGYTLALYQAARVCHGRPRGDFTYDLRDYPVCENTVEQATKMTGLRLHSILTAIEERLLREGKPELARRYAPYWHEDVLVAVRKKPRQFIALLTAESAFINALVELGLNRTPAGLHRFSKMANQTLRKVCGMDLRHLGVRALEETTRVLAGKAEVSGG